MLSDVPCTATDATAHDAGKTRAGAGITLGLLIKEGIIWPGTDVLSVEYKSVMTYATLTPDGQIICKASH